MPQTRDGRSVEIATRAKPGQTVFVIFGTLDGKPCHWTATGAFRMDGISDARDIVDLPPEEAPEPKPARKRGKAAK